MYLRGKTKPNVLLFARSDNDKTTPSFSSVTEGDSTASEWDVGLWDVAVWDGVSDQNRYDFRQNVRASGDIFSIWGGNTIAGAFGGEFRYEAYDDYRPPYAGLNPAGSGLNPESNDFLGFSPNSDTHGNRHVTAAYAETVIPLVGNKFTLPLVRSLELTASARYESYTDFGDTTKPKYGINWRPTTWIMARASYNEGFHAPNLAQLFTGTLIRTVTG
eukprot:gene12938-15814_t